MNHQKKGRIFGRKTNVRKALMKSLICALIKEEKITTTEAKAKELRPAIEKLVTSAKKDNLATKRMLISKIGSETLAKKLVDVIAPTFKDRNGGYTRITKLPQRAGDAAYMAVIEFVR